MSFINEFNKIDTTTHWLSPYTNIHTSLKNAIKNNTFDNETHIYNWLNAYFDHQKIALKNHKNHPLTFTHQNALPHGIAYEKFIDEFYKIPTRDNLHDWFGACVWSVFPKTKSLLNAKHLANLDDDNSANKRNRLRDTITVFDENGAILVISDEEIGYNIATALHNFDWRTCLIDNRCHWSDYKNADTHKKAKVFLFGHALLEQLINPYKSLCSHTITIPVPPSFFELSPKEQLPFLDNFLAYCLDKFLIDTVTPRQLNPLPILGVPYFWDNQTDEFYNDKSVFRSGRRVKC